MPTLFDVFYRLYNNSHICCALFYFTFFKSWLNRRKNVGSIILNILSMGLFSTNITLPMCFISQKVFTNRAMKPSRLQEHLTKMHANKKTWIYFIFKHLKRHIWNSQHWPICFQKRRNKMMMVWELRTFLNWFPNLLNRILSVKSLFYESYKRGYKRSFP